jgi:hypothetical protein
VSPKSEDSSFENVRRSVGHAGLIALPKNSKTLGVGVNARVRRMAIIARRCTSRPLGGLVQYGPPWDRERSKTGGGAFRGLRSVSDLRRRRVGIATLDAGAP